MRPQIITTIALTNDANGIIEDQTTGAAGALTLDGALVVDGVAYAYGVALPNAKQGQLIAIEGSGNNSGVVATITGTFGGGAQVEELTLANAGTATSVKYWTTVSSITVDGAVTGNIEGGWLSGSTSPMATLAYKTDYAQQPFNASIGVGVISGTLDYTVQHTFDLPQNSYGTSSWDADAIWLSTDGLSAKTATDNGNYAFPVMGSSLIFNSYTSGTVKFSVTQGQGSW